jgi:hypothetical protein
MECGLALVAQTTLKGRTDDAELASCVAETDVCKGRKRGYFTKMERGGKSL